VVCGSPQPQPRAWAESASSHRMPARDHRTWEPGSVSSRFSAWLSISIHVQVTRFDETFSVFSLAQYLTRNSEVPNFSVFSLAQYLSISEEPK
jgi:hypothetical protein